MTARSGMPRLVIVADDLTGALDSGAAFARGGLLTWAALTPDAVRACLEDVAPDVLTVSTRTRDVPVEEARQAVAEIMGLLPRDVSILKKVDSRLKGPIAAELDAIPHTRIVAMPAIPEFGRTVEAGQLCGFGVDAPISVAAALGAHADRAEIPDTRRAEDMDAWLALAEASGALLLGARGLAERLTLRMTGRETLSTGQVAFGDRLCIVAGSRDPITLRQVEHLLATRPDAHHVAAPNGLIGDGPVATGPLTVIQAVAGTSEATGSEVAANLARSLRQLRLPTQTTWLMTGGATAEAVLDADGIGRLDLLGEIAPGLPVCRADRATYITKSGGFGTPETLTAIADEILKN